MKVIIGLSRVVLPIGGSGERSATAPECLLEPALVSSCGLEGGGDLVFGGMCGSSMVVARSQYETGSVARSYWGLLAGTTICV